MTINKNAIYKAGQKGIIVLIVILFVVSMYSAIYQTNYMFREGLLAFIFFMNIFLKVIAKKNVRRSSVVLILLAISAMFLGFTGNLAETFITARSVCFYPMLCLVGGCLEENGSSVKSIPILYCACAVVLAVFGTVEFISPAFFERILNILRIPYEQENLFRGGIGYGVGSLFVSRQYFSTFLCLGIAIILNLTHFTTNTLLSNKLVQWGIASWFLVLIGLTLSRTIILAALVIVCFNLMKEVTIKRALVIICVCVISIFIAYKIPIVHDSISVATKSLNAMDVTMSGRTDIWSGYLNNLVNCSPNFLVLGNSHHSDYVGVADSVYIRFLVAYGYILSIIIILFLCYRLVRVFTSSWPNKKFFYSIVLFFAIASIAIDISFMFMIVVPVYILIGYEYCQMVNKRIEKMEENK